MRRSGVRSSSAPPIPPLRYQSVRPALLMDSLYFEPALSQLCHNEVEHGVNPKAWRAETGFFDALAPFLAGEPVIRALEIEESF